MDIRNTLSLAGGLLVLATAGYYWGGFGKEQSLVTTGDGQHLPDYEVSGIQGIQVNEHGQIERTLKADKLIHFPQTDRSVVEQPSMTLYQDGQAAWQVSAQLATAVNSNRQLELTQQVFGRRLQGPLLSLETDALNADQEAQTLNTSRPVLVRSAQGQISSTGLSANLKEGTLTFPANVRGNYVLSPR